jgi:hypothetical protein
MCFILSSRKRPGPIDSPGAFLANTFIKLGRILRREGPSSVDTLTHLSIEKYQSTRVVNMTNSSIYRKSGVELTKEFQISTLF